MEEQLETTQVATQDTVQKISASTIARTIILMLAMLNQILNISGHSIIPIDDETINLLVGNVWIVLIALRAWWKNNSFTKHAILADAQLRSAKSDAKAQASEDAPQQSP